MRRSLLFVVVAFSLFAFPHAEAQAQKKPAAAKNASPSPATPQQYALLSRYREMVGTVESIDRDSLVLRVAYDHPVPANTDNAKPNPTKNNRPNINRNNNTNQSRQQLQQQLHKLQQDQAALQRAKTPAQAQQKLAQILRDQQAIQVQLYRLQVQQTQRQQTQALAKARAKAGNVKTAHDFIDFDLPFLETATVRKLNLGVQYDAKGEVIEMPMPAKGAGNLPGFPAKVDDLVRGAKVKVYLAPAQTAAAPVKKDADGNIIPAAPSSNHPRIKMVVVLADAQAMPEKKKGK